MSAAHKSTVKAYDSAYPGSMHERDDGYYLCRNDHASLAAALVELIASRDKEIEDLRAALTAPKEPAVNAELLEALENIMQHIGSENHHLDGEWVTEPIHIDEVNAARSAIAKAGGAA